ncbi:MAG TPA: ABC transporter permease [Acidobacteriota bacterium]|nr:ABC transporter permease [Acidobacteriota bacterium]
MESLWQDLRYGVRILLKKRGFTLVAIMVLALGIGANTAIFSLVDAFLLKPLAFQKPEQLVGCYSRSTKNLDSYRAFSYPNYLDLREKNTVFTSLMAHNAALTGLTEGDMTRRVFADVVSSNYFETFGIKLFRGRTFLPAEEQPGSNTPVVILSYQFWQKAGADHDILGKTIRINGRHFTVIGIAPEGFTGTTALISMEFYLPLGVYEDVVNDFDGAARSLGNRDNHCLILVGRLRPGLTATGAEPELKVVAAQLEKAYPAENKEQTFMVHPLARFSITTSPSSDRELYTAAVLLMGMAAVVLLIACLNLANMLMARGTARRKEIAIRLALGGARRQIVRQLVTEGLVLSLLGGAAGIIVSYWATKLLVSSMSSMLPLTLVFNAGPDLRVLAATFAFCLLSTVMFGLGPAWKLSKPDVVCDLKENAGEDTAGRVRIAFFSRRNLLVIGQISLSLALLTTAGLFIRSALRAAQIDPGFRLENGLLVEVDPSLAGYKEARGREVYRALLERLASIPGVESVSLGATVPFGMVSLGRDVQRTGEAPASTDTAQGRNSVGARYNAVARDYFKTIGVRVLRGRDFNSGEAETGSAPPAAIVDDVLAKKLWPGEDPLGKQVQFREDAPGRKPKVMDVVGVVSAIRENFFEGSPSPHIYLPFAQSYQSDANIHLRLSTRSREAEATLMQAVRKEIRAIDDRVPVLALKTLRKHLDASIELWIMRTGAQMFSAFGAVALLLAVVGLYGVKAYMVARRTREIGIRMALGATAGQTLGMILREGVALTMAGVLLGFVLALGIGRLLSSMLYEVSGTDPFILSAAPAILFVVSMLACYIPARRAAHVDPMVALHYE